MLWNGINISHLMNADPNREPDMQMAIDMGRKAAEDATMAIKRSAALCEGPVEAGIAMMIAAHQVMRTFRDQIENQPADSSLRVVWDKIATTFAMSEEELEEAERHGHA